MRRPLVFALAAAILVLAAVSGYFWQRYQNERVAFSQMKTLEQTASARYAETIDAIAEIQDSLNAISLGSGVDLGTSAQGQEHDLSGPNNRQALDRISLLRASILRNKQRILALENDLRKSGIQVKGLQKLLGNLKADVAQKESQIAKLTGQVDSLQTTVAGLQTDLTQTQETVRARETTIEEKRRELATVFVAVGTRKELADGGVIAAKGGLLGLGKTLTPTGVQQNTLFHAMDTDAESVVHTNAPKVQVLSAQPPASYELKLVDGKMELHILDPQEFRKVKQLIIVTA